MSDSDFNLSGPASSLAAKMTSRIRPNRLGYLLVGVTTISLALCAFTSRSYPFSLNPTRRDYSPFSHLPRPGAHAHPSSIPFDRETYEPEHDLPLIIEESTDQAEFQQQGLRITLAQLYENARLDILGLDEEKGQHEEEGHEDYIYRLSMFARTYFEGAASQGYLKMMLSNLNLHISPPLLKTGLRKGIIQIVSATGRREVEGRWIKNRDGRVQPGRGLARGRGLKRDIRTPVEDGGWEDNTWTTDHLARAHERLGRGSKRLNALWGNLTRVEEQTVYIKHMSLLLWGGAYTDDKELITGMVPISEIAKSATHILHPALLGARSSLQPLAPPPPIPPKFIPPSLDPNWTKLAQSPEERVISLVLARRPRDHHHTERSGILRSETAMAKAFHPVFMDILDTLARRVDGEYIRLKGNGKAFDSSVLNLDEHILLEEAVDRYLKIQYGTNLEEVDRVAGDEAVVVGDVLLLAPTDL